MLVHETVLNIKSVQADISVRATEIAQGEFQPLITYATGQLGIKTKKKSFPIYTVIYKCDIIF